MSDLTKAFLDPTQPHDVLYERMLMTGTRELQTIIAALSQQTDQMQQEIDALSHARTTLLGRLTGLMLVVSNRRRSGVINTNAIDLDWLNTEEMNGTDLRALAHDAACTAEDHDMCELSSWGDQILIGGWKLCEGAWRPTLDSHDYAAIVNTDHYTIEVKLSRWTVPTRDASPCYRGYGDLDAPDTDAIMLTYSLPPNAIPADHPLFSHIHPG